MTKRSHVKESKGPLARPFERSEFLPGAGFDRSGDRAGDQQLARLTWVYVTGGLRRILRVDVQQSGVAGLSRDRWVGHDLLERGEHEAVLEYFESCRSFWTMGARQLDAWTATVRGGGIPAFGANLAY